MNHKFVKYPLAVVITPAHSFHFVINDFFKAKVRIYNEILALTDRVIACPADKDLPDVKALMTRLQADLDCVETNLGHMGVDGKESEFTFIKREKAGYKLVVRTQWAHNYFKKEIREAFALLDEVRSNMHRNRVEVAA